MVCPACCSPSSTPWVTTSSVRLPFSAVFDRCQSYFPVTIGGRIFGFANSKISDFVTLLGIRGLSIYFVDSYFRIGVGLGSVLTIGFLASSSVVDFVGYATKRGCVVGCLCGTLFACYLV